MVRSLAEPSPFNRGLHPLLRQGRRRGPRGAQRGRGSRAGVLAKARRGGRLGLAKLGKLAKKFSSNVFNVT